MAGAYSFARLLAADRPLMNRWLARPHVAEWWPDGEGEVAEVVAACHDEEAETVPYLVQLQGRPFAYLQCTRESADVRSIDQFIGEAELLGQGHGSAFIRQFCDGLFQAQRASTVTTDPDPGNARAVRAYEKAGFRRIGPRDTQWGHILLMQRDDAP